ncbi:MAG: insulinase family protein [Gammaproteobacteria bacterium]|nr:insulinase family protein [Gammaproteobacteria bacterium]NNL50210.1 insulinase family protein [Woeseiaceae bacterium]
MIAARAACLAAFLMLAGGVFAAGVSLPAYERVELPNGTILLLSEKHDVPLIGLEAIVRGGAVSDPDGLNGLAGLLAAVMQQGAGARDAQAFAEAVAAVGGELSVTPGLEGLHVSADFLARDAELMTALVADLLRRPRLEAEELAKLRERSISLIKATKGSSPGDLLPQYGGAFLFGDHPYGNPVGGSEATLAEITHEALLRYYEDHVGGDRLIISVVGAFDLEAMKARLTSMFGDWRAAAAPLPAVTAPSRHSGRKVLLIDAPGATQTYFWIGNIGVAIDFPQRADLNIANTVFGGRFTSMLNTELRVKSGLTYGARSLLRRPALPGFVVISSFTETGTTAEAIDMALSVLGKLRGFGVDADMVLSAQNYIMGQFPPRLETATQIAAQLARLEQYGLETSYIDEYGAALSAATSESVTAAIEAVYPPSEDLLFILVGDAASIREAASQYGPVTEMSINEPRFRP